ncbi:MAG: molybdate ABC transporter substrate-binding protein [Gammaproteobacteria bacterium]|nr:molybdate ABC transporter substrate-binding protein [Gammaproteobacteria bacterium]
MPSLSRRPLFDLLLLLTAAISLPAHAERVAVAVAANFTAPMQQIAARFEADTGHTTVVSYGSTGKLYAQIVNGAPFDVFLSADQDRPRRLHDEAHAESPFTYAIGRLVLWSPDATLVDADGDVLRHGSFKRLAIANPKTAPYGYGAIEILDALGVTAALRPRLVRGDNIAQTYQFVVTGNAELGFVAASQLHDQSQGSRWVPPQKLYAPIRQDSVLLARGRDNPAANALIDYLRGETARRIIRDFGYGTED